MKNSFNSIAPFYDRLASLFFGKEWGQLQIAPSTSLMDKERILIVGGGTGAILEYLEDHQQITYLDLSSKMVERAKARTCKATVDFLTKDYLQWSASQKYDAILFPFFLDSFERHQLIQILTKAKSELTVGGELLVVDFQRGTSFQNVMVWLMYRFFRVTTRLHGRKLLDLFGTIRTLGFSTLSETPYLSDWVLFGRYAHLQ